MHTHQNYIYQSTPYQIHYISNYVLYILYMYNVGIYVSMHLLRNNNKEKQRGCPLLGANKHTHIYIKYICVYILFICLRLQFRRLGPHHQSIFNYKYNFPWGQNLVDIESLPFLLSNIQKHVQKCWLRLLSKNEKLNNDPMENYIQN